MYITVVHITWQSVLAESLLEDILTVLTLAFLLWHGKAELLATTILDDAWMCVVRSLHELTYYAYSSYDLSCVDHRSHFDTCSTGNLIVAPNTHRVTDVHVVLVYVNRGWILRLVNLDLLVAIAVHIAESNF